jgi:NAD(P)-dependent dehydrogenase (short-subunit alcohol dehydrogenase family)
MMNADDIIARLPVLRGALALPSGDDDDPWRRVILAPAGEDVEPALTLDLPRGADDDIRKACHAALDGSESGPTHIELKGLGVLEVVRDKGDKPLSNKVALVTGAAGAIGAGICRGLLESGCRVAATDLRQDALDALVVEFDSLAKDRIRGVVADVTSRDSIREAVATIAGWWGGLDIAVPNAGLAHVSALDEMAIEDFQRLEKVNIDGTLLTLAEAGAVMRCQGTGGDIVLVSTKNVFAPGAQFGAYSATKAAAHQLARVASLEFAAHDVRVNMVAPDAVFSDGDRKSGLWAEVGPSRMKARGLDEEGLEAYYRDRNLLKTRVTARHVSNAVLFFITRQTPTTGATIPVDGGLPDATPR